MWVKTAPFYALHTAWDRLQICRLAPCFVMAALQLQAYHQFDSGSFCHSTASGAVTCTDVFQWEGGNQT
ncbi:hypothetical protein SRHO_G00143670 [Serrasalmus rhombeus]